MFSSEKRDTNKTVNDGTEWHNVRITWVKLDFRNNKNTCLTWIFFLNFQLHFLTNEWHTPKKQDLSFCNNVISYQYVLESTGNTSLRAIFQLVVSEGGMTHVRIMGHHRLILLHQLGSVIITVCYFDRFMVNMWHVSYNRCQECCHQFRHSTLQLGSTTQWCHLMLMRSLRLVWHQRTPQSKYSSSPDGDTASQWTEASPLLTLSSLIQTVWV